MSPWCPREAFADALHAKFVGQSRSICHWLMWFVIGMLCEFRLGV